MKSKWLLMALLALDVHAANDVWSYSGATGPQAWSTLDPKMSGCAGKNQSPINLNSFIKAELEPLRLNYMPSPAVAINEGMGLVINPTAGSMRIDEQDFRLQEVHFHVPSENQINGKSYPLEVHFVHVDQQGNRVVLAVMYQQGAANAAVGQLWQQLPAVLHQRHTLTGVLNLEIMLPANRTYYRFDGSLTTPPCTEGVRWLVLKHPVIVSRQQIASLAQLMGHPNNRPLQATNGRLVLK